MKTFKIGDRVQAYDLPIARYRELNLTPNSKGTIIDIGYRVSVRWDISRDKISYHRSDELKLVPSNNIVN